MKIIKKPSPNFGDRKGHTINTLVIHCTDGNFPSDLNWLCNPDSQVSSHYVVSPTGDIYSLVDESKTAWHAGKVVKPKVALIKDSTGAYINPNLYSIGIEVSLKATSIMTPPQEKALKELVADIYKRNNIMNLYNHRDIRSDKTCPGTINIETLKPNSFLDTISNKDLINEISRRLK